MAYNRIIAVCLALSACTPVPPPKSTPIPIATNPDRPWTLVVLSVNPLYPQVQWIAQGYLKEGLTIGTCLASAEVEAQQAENFTVQCVDTTTGKKVTIK